MVDDPCDPNNNEKPSSKRDPLPPLPQTQPPQTLILQQETEDDEKKKLTERNEEKVEGDKRENGEIKPSADKNSASSSGHGTSIFSTIASASVHQSSNHSLPSVDANGKRYPSAVSPNHNCKTNAATSTTAPPIETVPNGGAAIDTAANAANTALATAANAAPKTVPLHTGATRQHPRRCSGPAGCGTPPPKAPPNPPGGTPPEDSPAGSLGSLASGPLSVRGLSSAMQPQGGTSPVPAQTAPSPVKKAKRRCPIHGTPPRSAASSRAGSNGKGTPPAGGRRPSTAPSMAEGAALAAGHAASPTLPPAPRSRLPADMPPLGTVSANFWLAKKLHEDNLKHSPLPDAVRPGLFQVARPATSSAAEGAGPTEAEAAALAGVTGPAAVALRGRAGPTQVAKARVHRPRTAGVLAIPHVEAEAAPALLPAGACAPGSGSTDRAARVRYRRPVRPVDLAICWDLRPESPSAEPQPPTHLDGSNGSAAPAVFAMVAVGAPTQPQREGTPPPPPPPPPPVDERLGEKQSAQPVAASTPPQRSTEANGPCGGPGGCGTPMTRSGTGSSRRKQHRTAWPENNMSSIAASQGSANGSRSNKENLPPASKNCSNGGSSSGHKCLGSSCSRRRSGSAGTVGARPHPARCGGGVGSNGGVGSPGGGALRAGNSLHRSSPCVSAPTTPPTVNALPPPPPPPPPLDFEKAVLVRPKSDYKMAFKAGTVPTGTGRVIGGGGSSVRVPKPRAPFVRRSYSIDTLAPPFSLWPGDSGHAYPEHWRLASVYQHAYKPVERRRRPLLASVYQ